MNPRNTNANAVPAKWDATKIAPQTGKQVIVTGANSGIGFVTALELARHGANVVLACRNETKGREAVKKIEEELKLSPLSGKVEFRELDVSSLASVKTFADAFKADHGRIDLLINNAGIMAVPYAETADGIESQMATNHLGHFALTGRLLGLLKNSKHARVVNVSSKLHEFAKMDLNQITETNEHTYRALGTYNTTKLYNLLFSFELNRRLRAANIENVLAATAHPGLSSTNLSGATSNWFLRQIFKFASMLPIVQTSEYGALPTLYAAVGETIERDDFIGPDGFQSFTGYPTKEQPGDDARSEQHAKKLWEESEKLAKLKFTI